MASVRKGALRLVSLCDLEYYLRHLVSIRYVIVIAVFGPYRHVGSSFGRHGRLFRYFRIPAHEFPAVIPRIQYLRGFQLLAHDLAVRVRMASVRKGALRLVFHSDLEYYLSLLFPIRYTITIHIRIKINFNHIIVSTNLINDIRLCFIQCESIRNLNRLRYCYNIASFSCI